MNQSLMDLFWIGLDRHLAQMIPPVSPTLTLREYLDCVAFPIQLKKSVRWRTTIPLSSNSLVTSSFLCARPHRPVPNYVRSTLNEIYSQFYLHFFMTTLLNHHVRAKTEHDFKSLKNIFGPHFILKQLKAMILLEQLQNCCEVCLIKTSSDHIIILNACL